MKIPVETKPLPITVSEVATWLRCPVKSHYAHRDLRGLPPSGASLSIRFGVWWHEYMANILTAKQRPEIAPFTPLPEEEELLKECIRLLPYFKDWTPPSTWIVKAVEVPLSMPTVAGEIAGRLDGVVEPDGWDWSLQWKSCGPYENIETVVDRVRIGWHEAVYHKLAEYHGVHLHGTILGVLKRYTNKALAEGAQPLTFHYIARDKDEVDERYRDFLKVALDMHLSTQFSRIKNVGACYEYGRCPYYTVCHEGASIMDAPFVDLPNRYEDLTDG